MKIIGLILALLIWLLTAFGADPTTPTGPAPVPAAATVAPASPATAVPTASPVESEDTLMPEAGGEPNGSTEISGDENTGEPSVDTPDAVAAYDDDTLLPEI